MHKLEIHFVDSIADIGAVSWNELAGIENPFTRYEFLHALEQTGCTTAATGWAPHHVAVYALAGKRKTLAAIMPLYLKTNSYGEYVFDWSWASAYQSNGYEYYPKFVSAVPFTLSVGSRLYVRELASRPEITRTIRDKMVENAESICASTWHILFSLEDEHDDFDTLGIYSRNAR